MLVVRKIRHADGRFVSSVSGWTKTC